MRLMNIPVACLLAIGAVTAAEEPKPRIPLIDDMKPAADSKEYGHIDLALVAGWSFSQFDDGSGDNPIAGLVAYHRFKHIDYFVNLTFTGTEYEEEDQATLVNHLKTANSLHFGGGVFVPFIRNLGDDQHQVKAKVNRTELIDWDLGLIVKGGEFLRVEDKKEGKGRDAQGWVTAGVRTCLGPKCYLDVCWGRNEDLHGQRLVLAAQVPLLVINSEDRIRLYFRGEANLACESPREGEIHDDVFRASLALEIPLGVINEKLKLPLIGR